MTDRLDALLAAVRTVLGHAQFPVTVFAALVVTAGVFWDQPASALAPRFTAPIEPSTDGQG